VLYKWVVVYTSNECYMSSQSNFLVFVLLFLISFIYKKSRKQRSYSYLIVVEYMH